MDSGFGASTSDEYTSEDEDHSNLARNITAYGYEPSASSDKEEQAAMDVPLKHQNGASTAGGDDAEKPPQRGCTEEEEDDVFPLDIASPSWPPLASM